MNLRKVLKLLTASVILSLSVNLSFADETTKLKSPLFNDIPQKVIFFGNSFTYYNNSLHYHLERMVRATTPKKDFKSYKFKAITIAGGKLTEHKSALPSVMREEPWDAVILQGHSREAISEEMSADFRNIAKKMVKTTQIEGGTPLLFMTWAYQHKPEMIESISQAYTELGQELGVLVAPVGLAFQNALQQHPEIKLYASDRVHPGPAGTYLAASTFYAVLYGKTPVGNPYNMWIEPKQAKQLQEIAWQTVQDYQQPTILHQKQDQLLVNAPALTNDTPAESTQSAELTCTRLLTSRL